MVRGALWLPGGQLLPREPGASFAWMARFCASTARRSINSISWAAGRRRRLAELRAELGDGETGGLRFKHLPTPTGVEPLILDERNAGAVFQAASQFNALEMVGPGVSPRQGIACYSNDPTQGPKCASGVPGRHGLPELPRQ